MTYKVIVIGGQGFEMDDANRVQNQCAMRNNCEKEHVGVFKNGDDFYVVPRSGRDHYRDLIEAETGIKSQVCTFSKDGSIKVW